MRAGGRGEPGEPWAAGWPGAFRDCRPAGVSGRAGAAVCAAGPSRVKRDMDLVRLLLLRTEDLTTPAGTSEFLRVGDEFFVVDGFDPDAVFYNFGLLVDAGFIAVSNRERMAAFPVTGMTWAGHEFLDKVRDPEIWREAKEGATKAGGFSLDLLGALAKGLIKKKIEQHTGIKLDL